MCSLLYVLSGQVRLILPDHDATFGPGEGAEFDTSLPHRFGPAGDHPVEILSLLGRHDHHVRAARRRQRAPQRDALKGFRSSSNPVQ